MFCFALVVVLAVVGGVSRIDDGRCDLVEVNHYAPVGCNGFTQLIAWDWSPEFRRWHAQQWLILTEWSRVGNTVWCAGDGVEVRIGSRLFRETWTVTDPERDNQKLFPSEYRRKVW